MKFGINQSISQTITQLSCIQLETPSSRLWNFWWIKTYTTFHFIRWRFYFTRGWFHYSDCIKHNKMIWHKIVFHLKLITDTCTKHQIETQNLGFKQTPSQGGVGGPNILLILAPTCFLLNNLWSVCRYIMGPFSSWRSLCRKGKPPHLKKYVRNRWSPIQISNRFISKLHILHKSDNIVH